MDPFPTISKLNEKLDSIQDAKDAAYLKRNCEFIEAKLQKPHYSDPIKISMSGDDKGDWKTYYVFNKKMDEKIMSALNRVGFSCSIECDNQCRSGGQFINIGHPLQSNNLSPPVLALDPSFPFSSNFCINTVRANMKTSSETGLKKLKEDIAIKFAEHNNPKNTCISVPVSEWSAYVAYDYVIQAQKDHPEYKITCYPTDAHIKCVSPTNITIEWLRT